MSETTPNPVPPLPAEPGKSPGVAARLRKGVRGLAKRVVPAAWIEEVRLYRRVGKKDRSLYLRLRVANRISWREDKRRRVPASCQSMVFVCFGNIMRSPMAEALFRKEMAKLHAEDVRVLSAGLNAVPGRLAHERAVVAAREFGVDLTQHGAQLLTRRMIEQSDAVLAMDYFNLTELVTRFPDCAQKFYLLGAYSGDKRGLGEIPDPFFGDLASVERCYQTLQHCVQNLAAEICGNRTRGADSTLSCLSQ